MSKGSNNVEFEKALILKGWVRGPDGNLAHPSRATAAAVGGLVPGVREQSAGPLDGATQAVGGGAGCALVVGKGSVSKSRGRSQRGPAAVDAGPVVTVRFICIRPKLLDDDNLAGGCKSLRDAVADWLGVDDGDPRVEWIYRQQVGPKPHGTIVMITTKKG